MIEHKNIPDAQLHEPKGIVTAGVKRLYFADGAGSGSWRKLNELDIDYTNKAQNLFGWNDISDSALTVGSPVLISSGVRATLTNNGAASQSDTSRLGAIWITGTNSFTINDLNALYLFRIQCKVKTASAAGTPYVVKFEIESSNGPTTISAQDYVIKGGNYENAILLNTPVYMGAFINNYDLKVRVTPDTNISLWDIGFVVQRLYKEV